MARPKIEIDTAEVERLAGQGLSHAEIALSLGVSEDTLSRRKKESADFAAAIKRGRIKAADAVSSKLYALCLEGNLGAIIWYEKTRRGMTDKVVIKREDLDAAIERELAAMAGRGEASTASQPESQAVN